MSGTYERTFSVSVPVERAWRACTDPDELVDLVLYVDGLPIFERTDLWPFQIAGRPGDRLTIEVGRNGSRVRGAGELRSVAAAR